MVLSSREFQVLVSAFQFMFDSLPQDTESDLLYSQIESFLSKLDFQTDYRLSDGELQNCIIALQMFCAGSTSASPEHHALLHRFLALQFRSF